MGKLVCRCGNIMFLNSDTTSSADLLPNRSLPKLEDAVLEEINSLITALQKGQTVTQWLGVSDTSTKELTNALLFYRIWSKDFLDLARSVYQCEVCHRVLIETGSSNHFRAFIPDSEDVQNIF